MGANIRIAISSLSAKNPQGSMRCPRGFYDFSLKSTQTRKLIFLPLTQLETCAKSVESKICVLFFLDIIYCSKNRVRI